MCVNDTWGLLQGNFYSTYKSTVVDMTHGLETAAGPAGSNLYVYAIISVTSHVGMPVTQGHEAAVIYYIVVVIVIRCGSTRLLYDDDP